MENNRKVKDKRYEDKHKAERKAKCMVWGTSVPREKAEQINYSFMVREEASLELDS